MEWRRLKNIILILLVFVNVFLLVLVLSRQLEAEAYDRTAITQAVQALAGSGIEADPETLSSADSLTPIVFIRDTTREQVIAGALLGGTVNGGNLGGGITQYDNSNGEIIFRYGGEFSATFQKTQRWHTEEYFEFAVQLFQDMGLEAECLTSIPTVAGTDYVFCQCWNGSPLFSCIINLTYEYGYLKSMRGNLMVSGSVYQEAGTILTVPTALMRFLDGIQDSGDVCSSIRSLTAGYTVVQSFSSDVRMSPVWLVSTNTGQYFLDAITGELTRVEGETAALLAPD